MTSDLGVSSKALSLARAIDRLAPGDYVVQLEKRTRHDEGGEFEMLDFQIMEKITTEMVGNYGKSSSTTDQ